MNVDNRAQHPTAQQPQQPGTLPSILPSAVGGSSRKIGLSCAECRRSKLKCDRIFPCQSCVRRGCAGICPEGTLAATKGNKVLMAHAQRLQEQVKTLTAKNNELEARLAKAGINLPDAAHGESSSSMRGMEVENGDNIPNASTGSLSFGINGRAKYHGESASSEYLQDLLPTSHEQAMSSYRQPPDLPPGIQELLQAFPFGLRDSAYTRDIFIPFMPERDHALHLSELYFTNIGWMYEPISRADYQSSIFDVIYANNEKRVNQLHPHLLAVFFIVIANGAIFENNPNAEFASRTYDALARSAFSMCSLLHEANCATVQALFLIVRFIYNADRDRNEERWLLTGLNCRVAHMIGLQRDSANWNLAPDEVQRRRQIFWELFTWDAWTSVVNGRPAALAVQYTDCQFPEDHEAEVVPGKERDLSFHAWKLRYSANIVTASSFHVFNPRTPPYEALLDLDKKIRAFPLPSHLRPSVKSPDGALAFSPNPVKAMQQYCSICTRESNLLYIHRSYFAQALRELPDNPLHHRYAASVMATYRAATKLISSLRSLFALHPRPTDHSWFFWSGIFSSCIVLGALVVESPKCTLAPDALRELEAAIPFYEQGSRLCRSPGSVPLLEKLLQRAVASFQAGSEVPVAPSDVDELRILGGRKSVIKAPTRIDSPGPSAPGTPPPPSHDGNSPHSYAGAEEMLAEYLGQTRSQNTYPPPRYDGHASHPPHPPPPQQQQPPQQSMYGDDGHYPGNSSHPAHTMYMRSYHSPHSSDAGHLPYQARSPTMSHAGPSDQSAPGQGQPPPQGPPHGMHHDGPPQTWHSAAHSAYSSPPSVHHHPPGHGPGHPSSSASASAATTSTPGQQGAGGAHQAPPHPSHGSSHPPPMLYGHPLDVNPPQSYHPTVVQRFGPGIPQQRTQEEIWRDFMMGYSQNA